MNDFKIMLTKRKEIIAQQLQTNKKVFDKDIAQVLNIKATTLAGMKHKGKPPYQAINLMFERYCLMEISQLLITLSTTY